MRKGSKKPVLPLPTPPPPMNYESPFKPLNKFHPIDSMIDIILRLCDACHEMDTRTEPWSSIRKDIENLR
jgi:hypothetical protein